MQNILYNKRQKTIDRFLLEINSGGELNIRENGIIEIIFEDKKFKEVIFPFSGKYTRNGWRILVAIENEISKIEKRLNI